MAFEDVYADVASTSYVAGYYDSVNERYAEVLRALMPHGTAWTFEDTSDFYKLLRALSYSFCRVAERAQDLLKELDPRTTYEMLEDWERVLGLPGDNPTPPTTLADRRGAVHAKLLGNGDPTPALFEALALGLGYDPVKVRSHPYSPFVAGSTVGTPIRGWQWAYVWQLLVLAGTADDTLEWLVASLTPAHTQCLVTYCDLVERANAKVAAITKVVHANGVWVGVGWADGADAYILTSPDGVTWTERANAKNFNLFDLCFGDGTWVAVGAADGADAYILSSTDNGATWTERANAKNKQLNRVVYNGSMFVAVGIPDGVDAYIITSPDGITWTERANAKNKNLSSLVWGNGIWVAVGQGDGVDAYILSSTDGITWTERANAKNIALNAMAYGGGLFVAVGSNDGFGDTYIITSPDGITWTERANPKTTTLNTVAYGNGLWVAVGGADATDAYIITSPDGITWTERANPKAYGLRELLWANDVWVAGGNYDGVDNYLLSSADGETWLERSQPTACIAVLTIGYDEIHDLWVLGGDADLGGDTYLLTGVFF